MMKYICSLMLVVLIACIFAGIGIATQDSHTPDDTNDFMCEESYSAFYPEDYNCKTISINVDKDEMLVFVGKVFKDGNEESSCYRIDSLTDGNRLRLSGAARFTIDKDGEIAIGSTPQDATLVLYLGYVVFDIMPGTKCPVADFIGEFNSGLDSGGVTVKYKDILAAYNDYLLYPDSYQADSIACFPDHKYSLMDSYNAKKTGRTDKVSNTNVITSLCIGLIFIIAVAFGIRHFMRLQKKQL